MNNDNDELNNITHTVEKIKKYGDQKINFYKTLALIVILIIFLVPIRQKFLDLFQNSRHLAYYPKETQVYLDFDTSKFNSQIQADKYLSNIANNSEYFSFGFWKTKKGGYYNKLAIFQFKEKSQPDLLVSKMKKENYKHHQIFYLTNQNKVYTVYKEKLFISDRKQVLKDLITRLDEGRKGLFEEKNVRNLLGKLDKNRDGTIFVLDHKLLTNKSIINKIPGLPKVGDFVDISAFAVYMKGNNITAEGKTVLNYKKIKDEEIINSFKNFNKEPSILNENCYVPEKAMMYASVGNLKNTLNWFLALNDVKQQPEYKQMLDVVNESTGLDVENNLLPKFNGCSSLVLTQSGKNTEAAGIFRTSKNPQPDIIKLANFFQMQNNTVNLVDSNIQGYSLKYLKTNKIPYSIYFGMIGDNNFVIGQQNAIKEIIDAIKKDQIEKNTLPKAQASIYLDANAAKEIINRLKKREFLMSDDIDFIKAEISTDDNIINSLIKIGVKKIDE